MLHRWLSISRFKNIFVVKNFILTIGKILWLKISRLKSGKKYLNYSIRGLSEVFIPPIFPGILIDIR